MITVLSHFFIKDRDRMEDGSVRRAYGMLCSIVGILLNVLLFAGKYLAGVLSGSIAITADAFNNLSDAGSSFITLVGFRFSGMKADASHPFGHGRIEYISGFGVSVVIILMGVELLKTSVEKILHPERGFCRRRSWRRRSASSCTCRIITGKSVPGSARKP